MANGLSGTALGTAMKAAVDSYVSGLGGAPVDRVALFQALGTAIVSYITANALVTVTIPSVSGVTVGPGTSGPGSGVGSIS